MNSLYAHDNFHLDLNEFPVRTSKLSNVQHYVIHFVSDLRQDGGFHRELRFPPPIKVTAAISCNIVVYPKHIQSYRSYPIFFQMQIFIYLICTYYQEIQCHSGLVSTMFVSLSSNTTVATNGSGTAYPS